MTVIRIDPPQLDEMASLLDSTAGEYDSLAGMLASPDLGSMPANVAGIVGQAYAEARATSTSLAGEFCAEARTLRFRCVTAAEQGGLACQLGSLGSLGFAAGLGSAFLSPYGAAGVGGALSAAWGGVVVGSQSASSAASGLGFGGSSFTPGSTVAGGSVFTVGGSNPFILGGAPSSAVTTITIGGTWDPGYTSVMPGPNVITIGGTGGDPGYSSTMPGSNVIMVGGTGAPGYSSTIPGPSTFTIGGTGGDPSFSSPMPGSNVIMVGGTGAPGYSSTMPGPSTITIGGDHIRTLEELAANPGAYYTTYDVVMAAAAAGVNTGPFMPILESQMRGTEVWLAPSGHSFSWTGSGERIMTNTSPYYDRSTGLYPGGSRPG